MDYDIIIFWLVLFSCLSGLVMVLTRIRYAGIGWVVVYLSILLVAAMGALCRWPALIYASAVLWGLLVVAPGLVARLYQRSFLQQRYSAARRFAQIISCLHPADGWREQPRIILALDLAQRGEQAAALEILNRYQNVKSILGMAAVINFHQLTGRWDELVAWQERNLQTLDRYPPFLPSRLRAKGETGDVRGLVELYSQRRPQIEKLVPASSRGLCRLQLFAFCGRRPAVERLFAGSLGVVPISRRQFWLATADQMAGNKESAKTQFEQLLPVADPSLQLEIQRRFSQLSSPPPSLDASAEIIVAEAAREQEHDENFGAQRSLFSKQARATQILISLNLLMFLMEIASGGGTNGEALYRLGAFYAPAVHAGEWWRLVTCLFLHYGWLHLAMNMLALWWMGPFLEFALGFRRYLLTYLLAGIGSMGTVMLLSSGPRAGELTVGASGCIMGLIGATGALMLRGWRREKAAAAKRRLAAMLIIVGMQTIFDFVVPQVSMTAHLAGAALGFAIALTLRDRLQANGAPASGPAR